MSLSIDIVSEVTLAAGSSGVHNAFGGATVCANGDVLTCWRRSTGHAGRGPLLFRRSSDNGATFDAEYSPMSGASELLRGGSLSTMSDGSVALVTGTSLEPIVAFSSDDGATFSTATVTHGFSYGAVMESQVVEALNGDLLIAGYGRDTDDASNRWTSFILRSTDGGETFGSRVDLAVGPSRGLYFNETGLAVTPGRLFAFIREDTNFAVWVCVSRDHGLTWSTLDRLHGAANSSLGGAPKILNAGGKMWWLARSLADSSNSHVVRMDPPLPHWDSALLGSGLSVYGQVVELSGGSMGAIYSTEPSTDNASAYFATFDVT